MVPYLYLTANFRNREAYNYPSCFANEETERNIFFFPELILLGWKACTKTKSSDSWVSALCLIHVIGKELKGKFKWAWTALDIPKSPFICNNDIFFKKMYSKPKIEPRIEPGKWPNIFKEWVIALQEKSFIFLCHETTGLASGEKKIGWHKSPKV